MSETQVKFMLGERDIPTHWVNLMADLPGDAPPPLHPGTKEPAGPDDLTPMFPMALILQEVASEPEIEIPDARARGLQAVAPDAAVPRPPARARARYPGPHLLQVRGRLAPGSHKANTAVAQAYENAAAGIRKLTTETGAGQWGSALSFACQLFGLECEVWMVGSSYDQKPYRRSMIETWGATVHRSPSDLTAAGRAQRGHTTGSLGIAISEAVEVAGAERGHATTALGSVLNHVLLHQTVIGQEALAQMEMAGEYPDTVIACVGGGSNFGGLTFPFLRRVLRDGATDAVHRRRAGGLPDAHPRRLRLRLRRHRRADAADADVHARARLRAAAGPRRRACATTATRRWCARLSRQGIVEARAYRQNETFEAAVRFARTEGIIPAPEPAHAIRAVIEEAEAAREAGEERVILFGLCGHGHFDLSAYDAYLAGKLEDPEFSEADVTPRWRRCRRRRRSHSRRRACGSRKQMPQAG